MFQYQYEVVLGSVPPVPTAQIIMNPPPSTADQNEDWTQIADLALRRRIQNRIAQRNYRNKLKRRLRELERWAATPEASLPTTKCEKKTQALKQDINESHAVTLKKSTEWKEIPAPPPTTHSGGVAFSQPVNIEDSYATPCMPYWSSLSQDKMFLPAYAYAQSYPITTMVDDYTGFLSDTPASYMPSSIMQLDEAIERK